MATPPPASPPSGSPRETVPRPSISLQQPSNKRGPSKSTKLFRRLRSVFQSFPIITPMCKIPVISLHNSQIHGGTRMTGTLFGYRKARINLAIQENPRSLPVLLLELAIPTGKLLQDLGMGAVRIALECEKKPTEKIKIIDESGWTLYCNGRKSGYGVKRDPTEDDLLVMQMIHAISMGAGVLPTDSATSDPKDGELTFMRANFERVVGSKDSEDLSHDEILMETVGLNSAYSLSGSDDMN